MKTFDRLKMMRPCHRDIKQDKHAALKADNAHVAAGDTASDVLRALDRVPVIFAASEVPSGAMDVAPPALAYDVWSQERARRSVPYAFDMHDNRWNRC